MANATVETVGGPCHGIIWTLDIKDLKFEEMNTLVIEDEGINFIYIEGDAGTYYYSGHVTQEQIEKNKRKRKRSGDE